LVLDTPTQELEPITVPENTAKLDPRTPLPTIILDAEATETTLSDATFTGADEVRKLVMFRVLTLPCEKFIKGTVRVS
jgi:hypothetical protein